MHTREKSFNPLWNGRKWLRNVQNSSLEEEQKWSKSSPSKMITPDMSPKPLREC